MPHRLARAALRGILIACAAVGHWAGPAAAGEVIDRIARTGELRLGFRTDAPPFASVVDGAPQGFTIDLCARLAEAIRETSDVDRLLGRFLPVGTERRFEALANGEIDILCGATTATLGRRETVSFSIPTFLTGVSVVMRSDAPALAREVLIEKSPAAFSQTVVDTALAGLRLGVRRATTAEDWLGETGIAGSAEAEIVPFESHESGIAAVETGEIAAYFADRAILLGLLRGREGDALVLAEKSFTQEPYALAIPRGDEDFRLALDRALSRLYRSGEMLAIVRRHFGPPPPEVTLFYQWAALPE